MAGKKKKKITYIDDGRTIADMSGISSGHRMERNPYRPPLRFKEVWKTYWTAVKMMLRPMLVVVIGLILIYVILYFLFLSL